MNIETNLRREHMQPGVYIVTRSVCRESYLMKCIHITTNSEYIMTMWEDQFVHYIMLAIIRFAHLKV